MVHHKLPVLAAHALPQQLERAAEGPEGRMVRILPIHSDKHAPRTSIPRQPGEGTAEILERLGGLGWRLAVSPAHRRTCNCVSNSFRSDQGIVIIIK